MKKLTSAILLLSLTLGVGVTSDIFGVPALAKKKAENTEDPMLKNFNIGMDYYKKGDYDGAIDAFLQSVYFARNSYAPESYHFLAASYMAKNEDPKAIEAIKKAIEQSTGEAFKSHILLARLYLRNKRYEEAELEANHAMGAPFRSKECCEAHFVAAKIFEAQQNWTAAQAQFEFSLGDKPWTYSEAWMGYAEMFMKQKNWVSAIAQFRDMLESQKVLPNIDYAHLHMDLGICLLAKGDHQGALTNWHRGLSYNMNEPDIHLQLAMMFDAERHVASAVKEYKEFCRYSGDQIRIAKAKQRLEMLEQSVAPAEAPYQVKPSPAMRKQMEEQANAENTGGGQPITPSEMTNPKDPGF
ncbi:MAG TPA: tetratricopeptide repeat protein [Drouetiella sp.]